MADDVPITAGSGTTIATDQDAGSGRHYQLVKLVTGALDTFSLVSATNPVPIAAGVTAIGDGNKVVTTAGTRVTLAASTAARQVIITASAANTGTIVVGGTTCVAAAGTRRGTPLLAGDTLTLDVKDLADVNLDATVSGEGVSYTYIA